MVFAYFAYIDPGSGFTFLSGAGWIIGAVLLPFLVTIGFFFKRIFRFFFRHKKLSATLIIVILCAILITIGVYMKKVPAEFNKRIVILGMDGLSPTIMERMMDEGKLPSFSRLKKTGSFSPLSTTNPSQSPVAWAGFATGKNPGKHRMFDFIRRNPKGYKLDLAITQIMGERIVSPKTGKSFWHYTSELKVPTVIIGCPITFPPEKVYGRMLSGMGTPDILGTQGTFSFYTTEQIGRSKDIGGKVFNVTRDKVKLLKLAGPRKATAGGKTENVTIPFKVTAIDGEEAVKIDIQGNHFKLNKGEWSDWKEAVFDMGLFRKMRGILKFYLVETAPEFKLYVSPINFDPRDPFFPITYPKGYSKELVKAIGLFYTQGMPCDTWSVNEKRLTEEPFLEQVGEVLREKKAMLDYELGRFERGVLYCYFETPDIIQHMFWRYTDPEHPLYEENAPQKYKNTIANWYQKMDSILAEVMDRLTEEDTLIVLSDHGFDTFRRAVHINAWLRENGYLELNDPRAKSGRELLMDIDWLSTKAYAMGFGSIYINQMGRESEGTVRPGEETERLKKEIAEKLLKWQDDKYHSPVINSVYEREEIFWGPYADQAPDLFLGFNIGYRASWQTAMGGVPEGLIEDNLKKWSGSHLFDPKLIPGILFTNRPVSVEDPSIYDITPTILSLVGVEDEELKEYDFDGRVLF